MPKTPEPEALLSTQARIADLKQRYPQVWIHGMSPPEITHLSKMEKRPVRAILEDLKAAGLDSIPGGGAEMGTYTAVGVVGASAAAYEAYRLQQDKLGMQSPPESAPPSASHAAAPRASWPPAPAAPAPPSPSPPYTTRSST